MENSAFFSENGLTSTSANHVANLAKELMQDEETSINSITLLDCFVSVIGQSEKTQVRKGISDSDLRFYTENAVLLTESKSLIAWLREAIKAKEKMLEDIERTDIDEWAVKEGKTMPTKPERREVPSKEERIAAMNIKERNRILKLETEAAVFGKCVHPDSAFSKARKELHNRLNNPIEVKGEGRDALVYTYEQSCDYDAAENIFFTLQQWHRETQAELNGILCKIDEEIRTEQIAADTEYVEARKSYEREYETLRSEFRLWKETESKRVASLKIAIPNELKGIYEKVSKRGK